MLTMTQPSSRPGWYPDPSGKPGQRYFDGANWTEHFTPHIDASGPELMYGMERAPVAMRQPTAVVEGPNHALHAVLTLLTFWACGGWAWVWLIVALSNKKRVRYL
jgi:hypothetical protein